MAGNELGNIGMLLNETDRGDFILRKMLLITHDDQNENNRIVSI